MDINLLFTLGTMLVTVTAFIVTTSVLVNVTRADFKDFKNLVETRFIEMENRFDSRFVEMENRFDVRFAAVNGKFCEMENRLNRLEVDVAEIKAICRERSGRDTPV
ncbi:MAG: hypothetical protein LBD07_02470 [Spirochaetaceae bacterium]|jgi:hypothetical protein|nr:hypothetical protein [Spirochaetaceae bacterium]